MKIFLYYDETANINYSFIIALYRIAEKGKNTKIKDTIHYASINELRERIKENCGFIISVSTISRIFKDTEYNNYICVDRKTKTILLNNDYTNSNRKRKFIVLNENETDFILKHNDNLLTKYYLYLKYYCGLSKSKTTDSTAKQILCACGYSDKSNLYISRLAEYNKLLCSVGFI